MAKQNYRCAGCGMKVAVEYANRFRYCEYLGRYFCTGCHTNQLALIPGKILSKWDFTRYPFFFFFLLKFIIIGLFVVYLLYIILFSTLQVSGVEFFLQITRSNDSRSSVSSK